ncbi:MAG: PAS domain-containing sensor histidine kinase [Reichenbachiella sp.]
MKSSNSKEALVGIVRDPILLINQKGKVLNQHFHEESDPAFVDLELVGKNIGDFEFFRDTKDCIPFCLETKEPRTSYFSWAYGGQLKHYEALMECHDEKTVLVLIKEITKKKQRDNELLEMSDLIQNIYEGTASWTGHDYLDHLTIQLAKSLKSDCTAIFIHNEEEGSLESISIWDSGSISKNVKGTEIGSPWDHIMHDDMLEIRSGFTDLYPDFFLLEKIEVSSFVGVPMYYKGSDTSPMGFMAAMYKEPIQSVRLIDKILKIFSTRAVTELEQMENLKMVERSEQKFKALYNNTPALFNSVDQEGKVIEAGDFFLEITGYLREEVIGQPAINFVTKESQEYGLKEVFPKFSKLGYCKDVPLQFIKKNGDVLDVMFSATLVKDEKGRFEKIVTNLNDVTKLRRIENELKESEAKVAEAALRFQSLFDNSPVGIIIHTDGIIKQVNSETIKLARGTSSKDFVGKEALSFIHHDSLDAAKKRIDNIMRTKKAHRNEQKFLRLDGTTVEVEAQGNIIEYEGKTSIQIAIYDITERKKAQQAILENESKLKSLNDNLFKQNHQLEEFAHIASHNLRAPVTNMLSLVKIKETDPTPENEVFVWDNIKKTIVNLEETLIELNDVVKTSWELDKNRRRLKFEMVLDKIVDSFRNEIKKKNAIIETNFTELPSIYYPKVYLESIMQNLLTNAIKYSDKSRNPIISITTKVKDGNGYLIIQDNGLGIDLNKFGKKLFGLRKTFHQNEDARGVGLFITKAQIETMGGSISVESEVGKGSIFSINFGEV